MEHCGYCGRPSDQFDQEGRCEVCVSLKGYHNAADLAEDFGVYDPEAQGYVWVEGKGYALAC